MKSDVAPLHYLMKGSHLDEDKFISRHGVPIILTVTSNMSCINLLTPTHNLSMDRKLEVHSHARLKSLLHLIWNLEWHLWIMRMVNHSIFFIDGS